MPVTRASICLAISFPLAQASLVADWKADTFVNGQNWTSTTGGIVATISGTTQPVSFTDPAFNGHKAVEFTSSGYFTVAAPSNPLDAASELTLVAVFEPMSNGSAGGSWWQSSGLIGMEQGGSVADWGFGWNGPQVSGGVGGPDVTMFSPNKATDQIHVAMMTWNSTTGQQRLFVNGVQVDADSGVAKTLRNGGAFALGAMTSGGATPFDGRIAELRMYNSDETANASTIFTSLRDTYIADLIFTSATAKPQGGTIVVSDTANSQVDAGGTFTLTYNGNTVPVTVNKAGGVTTINFTATVDANTPNFYTLSVPRVAKPAQEFSGDLPGYLLPLASQLAGPAGSTTSWGIREYANPDLLGNIAVIEAAITGETPPTFTDGAAPVFNHFDPDTNNVTSIGSFTNDFNILSSTAAPDDNFIVVGKSQVTVPAAGVYTFSVRSDDGFAMRVSGTGGGRFISTGGDGQIDAGDNQTLFRNAGGADSNSRGTYQFDAAGTYDILYLGWDGGSGGYYEVSWAPGTFAHYRETNTWQLVGNPADPSIPPHRERFVATLPGPAATADNFGIRSYLSTAVPDNIDAANTFLATTTRSPSDVDGLTVDDQEPVLNHADPQNGGQGQILGTLPFPGDTAADDNNVITTAKGRISIPSTGSYTFNVFSDDGFMLRLKGVGANPDPSFKNVTQAGGNNGAAFSMSNPNEVFFNGAGVETRSIVVLTAGEYDIEFLTVEGGGGFHYELSSAAGEWPIGTAPLAGFQLVGYDAPVANVIFPKIAAPGWTVESSINGLTAFANNIAGAEARISTTASMSVSDPIWADRNIDPANRTTIWDKIDFRDPEDGSENEFTPTNAWPLNTGGPDNDYAVKATGTLNITTAGVYHLGFQGDDGGYMYIYGVGANPHPVISSIVYTNHAPEAQIGNAPEGGTNNAIRVEVGTGNSRTIVAVPLQVGQYTIKTLFWEGGGGSWWEVIGSSAVDGNFSKYPLLTTGTEANFAMPAGLGLTAQPAVEPNDPNFKISGFVISGSPVTTANFTFGSQVGVEYTVEASTTLQAGSWIPVETVTATGTTTAISVDLTDFPALTGQPKVFFRVQF